MTMPYQPWRAVWRPASYKGAGFYIEVGGKAGGRRNVHHEYPKRDDPYAEDMGRKQRKFHIQAYLIGPNYLGPRDRLIVVCEQEGAGLLVHPTLGQLMVVCDTYSVSETREKGGYCTFEMTFSEAGVAPSVNGYDATQGAVQAAAQANDATTVIRVDADCNKEVTK